VGVEPGKPPKYQEASYMKKLELLLFK